MNLDLSLDCIEKNGREIHRKAEAIMVLIAVLGGLLLAGAAFAALKNFGNSPERRHDKFHIA